MRKKLFSLVIAIVLAVTAFSVPITAYAGTVDGEQAFACTGVECYNTYSRIQTNSTHAVAYQFTRCTSSSAVAGEIGSLARLYRSSGALYSSSGWQYNGSTYGQNVAIGANVTTAQPRGTSWFAKGSAQYYLNGGYKTLNSYQTRNQTVA